MKLYIWREVLRDYTPGLAVAVAESVTEARGLLAAEKGVFWGEDLAAEPEVLEFPAVAWVHGGG